MLGDGRGAANRPSSGGKRRAAVASGELQRRPASRGLGIGRAAPRIGQGAAAGREATPRRDGEQDLQRRRPADQMLGLVRLNRKTEPNKPKPNSSVFSSLTNQSVAIAWKPKFFETEQTEPICRFKPNAQAELAG